MSEREEVIDEFAGTMECCRVCLCGNENKAVKDMADEIVRLRSALTAASEGVSDVSSAAQALIDAYNNQRSDSEKDAAWTALARSLTNPTNKEN